jgi:hypothetical protein
VVLRIARVLDCEIVGVLISAISGVNILDPVSVFEGLLEDQLEVWVANPIRMWCAIRFGSISRETCVLLLNQHQIRDVRRRVRYDDVVWAWLAWLPHHKQPAYT